MSAAPEPAQRPAPEPPPVDDPRVAEALQRISDLDEVPLSEHHDRLVRAHEVLHDVLHPDPAAR